MKTSISLKTLFLLSGLALAGCSQSQQSENVVIPVSAAAINSSDATPVEKAEEIAKGAELLLSGDGIQQASDMAALALQSDSGNFRARLIHKMLAPLVLQKGIVRRLRPLAEKNPLALTKLNETTADLEARAPRSAGAMFLLDGSPDIRSEADLQTHLDRTIEAAEEFRNFLRDNKDREITAKVSSAFTRVFAERFAAACELITNSRYEYELVCPPSATRKYVSLNRADFEILHDMITYYMIQLMVPSAFDLDGAIAEANPDLQRQALYDRLLSNASFGRLREAKYLKRVRALGIDLVTALNWAMEHQNSMCPKGTQISSAPKQRPGMLFDSGLCTYGSYFKPLVDTIAFNLDGQPRRAEFTANGSKVTTTIFWLAPFERPIANLRELGVLKFKSDGDLESTTNPTLGGIFPNGDANLFLGNRNSPMVYR